MRRFFLLLTLASCTNPDEILPVSGRVASVDPVEGQVVRLLRRVQPVISGGETCDSSAAVAFKETQADAEGNYGFDVFRVEAEHLTGNDVYCFRVDATFPSGSTASSDFQRINFETAVNRLLDWRAAPRLENDVLLIEPAIPWPEELPIVPDDPAPVFTTPLNHRAVVTTLDGGLLWQVEDRFVSRLTGVGHREPMVLDSLRLEDFSSSVTMHARLAEPLSVRYGLSGGEFAPPVALVSGERLSVIGARTPVSRGVPCPELGTPCPLTDGDLTAIDLPFVKEVRLSLRVPATLSAIVFRGMELGRTNVGMQFSFTDGGTERFTAFIPENENSAFNSSVELVNRPLPDGGFTDRRPSWSVVPLDAGAVEAVTLTFGEGLSRIQEISLFE